MKNIKLLFSILITANFFFLSEVSLAQNYIGALGDRQDATDIWYFTCTNPNNSKVKYRIKRTSGTPCVQVNYNLPGGGLFATRSDCPSSPGFQRLATISQGPGNATFTVKKRGTPQSRTGNLSYTVEAYCIDKNGNNIPSDQSKKQTYIQNE